jgi:hypothetical protein
MPIGSSGDISIYVRWIGMGGGRLFDLSYPGAFFLFYIGKSRVFGWGRKYE